MRPGLEEVIARVLDLIQVSESKRGSGASTEIAFLISSFSEATRAFCCIGVKSSNSLAILFLALAFQAGRAFFSGEAFVARTVGKDPKRDGAEEITPATDAEVEDITTAAGTETEEVSPAAGVEVGAAGFPQAGVLVGRTLFRCRWMTTYERFIRKMKADSRDSPSISNLSPTLAALILRWAGSEGDSTRAVCVCLGLKPLAERPREVGTASPAVEPSLPER